MGPAEGDGRLRRPRLVIIGNPGVGEPAELHSQTLSGVRPWRVTEQDVCLRTPPRLAAPSTTASARRGRTGTRCSPDSANCSTAPVPITKSPPRRCGTRSTRFTTGPVTTARWPPGCRTCSARDDVRARETPSTGPASEQPPPSRAGPCSPRVHPDRRRHLDSGALGHWLLPRATALAHLFSPRGPRPGVIGFFSTGSQPPVAHPDRKPADPRADLEKLDRLTEMGPEPPLVHPSSIGSPLCPSKLSESPSRARGFAEVLLTRDKPTSRLRPKTVQRRSPARQVQRRSIEPIARPRLDCWRAAVQTRPHHGVEHDHALADWPDKQWLDSTSSPTYPSVCDPL